MDAQLHLIPELPAEPVGGRDPREAEWRLDESTRAVGKRGVAEARAALRSALRHRHDDRDHASAA